MSIDEFTDTLSALLSVKPPGVSGSKIKKLQEISLSNVGSESVLVQRLFTHCKKTPASHKLGALYVVDAIVRGWHDEAKKKNESVNAESPEGTPAAGVYRISELIEAIMGDALSVELPNDQKVRIHKCKITLTKIQDKLRKLVDIWERAETFPVTTLTSIREKYFKPERSTTPVGTPPSHVVDMFKQATTQPAVPSQQRPQLQAGSVGAPDTVSILQALASIAKKDPSSQPQAAAIAAPIMQQAQPSAVAGQPWNLPKPRERSPVNQYQQRSRSRSPTGRNQDPRMRSRSPQQSRQQQYPDQQPQQEVYSVDPSQYQPRHIRYVTDIPDGCIRVLSRTLFIGGVPGHMNEEILAQQFEPFAKVQSMVFHKEKKHSFVKVFTREEAEASKIRFETMNRSGESPLRARWGVGFGPRDCCDYQNGVSVIPIARLTEADKRWVVSADHGGTGGRPLVTGIEVEEPDIEIGSGVSSKAISKRMPTNSSRNGPRSTREEERWGRERNGSQDMNERSPPVQQQQPYQQQPQYQQPQPQQQQQQQPMMGMPAGGNQMPQFNPMQMMQMFQNGQLPPQFQQMAQFFQQQQQQQQPPPQ